MNELLIDLGNSRLKWAQGHQGRVAHEPSEVQPPKVRVALDSGLEHELGAEPRDLRGESPGEQEWADPTPRHAIPGSFQPNQDRTEDPRGSLQGLRYELVDALDAQGDRGIHRQDRHCNRDNRKQHLKGEQP